jgi:superfamily II DNA or RNA helicase
MQLPDLISRTDDETLQNLLGRSAINLLMLLDPGLATPVQLQKVLLELKKPSTLLHSTTDRAQLFDLLKRDEAKNLAIVLGVDSENDVYKNLKSISIRNGSPKETALFDFFEVNVPVIEEGEQSPSISRSVPDYPLFEHQRNAAEQVRRKLTAAPRRVILHMPTGSGKTRTAMHIIADHFRSYESAIVIWLAHSEELCEQAALEFQKAWSSLGNRELTIHRFWGNREINVDNLRDGFVVAGLAKLYSSIKTNQQIIIRLGSKASLVIIDEAHSAIAETYKLLLETLLVQNLDAALLGLTATPGRTWNDLNADEELAKFFRKQKVTLSIPGYDTPVDYLIEEGYLARPEFKPLMHEGGVHLSKADIEKIQESFEIPDSILRTLAEDEKRNLKVILAIEDLARTHQRILVFAATVEHSDLLASVLRARGLDAHSVTSKTSTFDRSRLIEEYKDPSEKLKILCNFGVLTTGFDAPKTSAAVIARPTQSLVLYSQMVGRAIRGKKAGGNKNAEVVTIIDQELPGFRSISDSFTNWDDVWS